VRAACVHPEHTSGHRPGRAAFVTHAFLIGWLVSHAMHAPSWRWMGLNHGNAALTVIRYAPGRPASVLYYSPQHAA
jgi:broad specificity phosphatase PhoE